MFAPSLRFSFFALPGLMLMAGSLTGCGGGSHDHIDTSVAYTDVVTQPTQPARQWASIEEEESTQAATADPRRPVENDRREAQTTTETEAEEPNPAFRGQAAWVAPTGTDTQTTGAPPTGHVRRSGVLVRPGGSHTGPAPILTRGEEAALQEKARRKRTSP